MEGISEVRRNIKLIVNVLVALIVLMLCIFLLPRTIAFFMPFIIGWFVSCIANPIVVFLENRIRIKRKAGTVVVIVTVIALVIATLYSVILILARQMSGFITDIPQMWDSMVTELNEYGQRITHFMGIVAPDFSEILVKTVDAIGVAIAQIPATFDSEIFADVSSVVGSVANILIAVIMSMLSAYFFIADREWLYKAVAKIIPISIMNKYDIFYSSLKQAVGGYFKAQIRIEVWIYFIILIGLLIFDVKYSILIALLIAIIDLLPFFGSGAVFLPWAIISFLCGNYWRTIGFVVIWGVSQLVRQLIQPKIMGDSIGMEPIPTLFLLYIGYKVSGVIGMIVAVPIGIIIVNMNEAGFFDTPKYSIRILLTNLNRFRKLDKEDMNRLKGSDKDA